MNRPHILYIGYGHVAQALQKRLDKPFYATARTGEKADFITEQGGIAILPNDLKGLETAFQNAKNILISVPPIREGDPFLELHQDLLIQNSYEWVGYLSTTGVYGDHGGEWVSEETPCTPKSRRSKNRLTAELQWLDLYQNYSIPVHIFRLSGIYGDHSSIVHQLYYGTAKHIVKEDQVFNRIHIEDIALALEESMNIPFPASIYNIADDMPCNSVEVLYYAAGKIGRALPPLQKYEDIKDNLSEMTLSFYAESKRVSSGKIKSQLNIKWIYPDYRVGIDAIIAKSQKMRQF